MKNRKNPAILIRTACAPVLIGLCALLAALAKGHPALVAYVYLPRSRAVSTALARAVSFTNLSVAELLVYLASAFFLGSLVRAFVLSVGRRSFRPLASWTSFAVLTAACLLYAFLSVWGLNYFAPALAGRLDGRAEARSSELLYDTAVWLRDEMNRLAPQVPRDARDVCDSGGFDALAARAGLGYDALAAQSDAFVANPPPPKRLAVSSLLSRFNVAGVYVPFVGEAVVDPDATDAHLPYTMCHELAHRMGYAPEDEANYLAFLACDRHPDAVFRYSGYHLAFIYCSNALGRADAELSRRLWEEVSPLAVADMRAQNERLKAYEGPLQSAGEKVNDGYLKAVGQEAGVESYGLAVDLLIAEYLARFGEE